MLTPQDAVASVLSFATAFAVRTLPRFVIASGILALITAVLIASGVVVLLGGGDALHTTLAAALFVFAAVPLLLLGTVILKRWNLV